MPFWQTTVVVEPDGTTTVVLAGGGGLLLLMQPDSIAAATTKPARIFIIASNSVANSVAILSRWRGAGHEPMSHSCMGRWFHALSSGVLQAAETPFDMGI